VDSNFPQLRHHIVTWIADLNEKFGFSAETLFLSVAVFDRFLVSVKVAFPVTSQCFMDMLYYKRASYRRMLGQT